MFMSFLSFLNSFNTCPAPYLNFHQICDVLGKIPLPKTSLFGKISLKRLLVLPHLNQHDYFHPINDHQLYNHRFHLRFYHRCNYYVHHRPVHDHYNHHLFNNINFLHHRQHTTVSTTSSTTSTTFTISTTSPTTTTITSNIPLTTGSPPSTIASTTGSTTSTASTGSTISPTTAINSSTVSFITSTTIASAITTTTTTTAKPKITTPKTTFGEFLLNKFTFDSKFDLFQFYFYFL